MKTSLAAFCTLIAGFAMVSRAGAQTALNPAGDARSGVIAAGTMVTFQVTLPDSYPGMRLVLATTGSGYADLYIQRGATVSTSNYMKAVVGQTTGDTLIMTYEPNFSTALIVGMSHGHSEPATATWRLP